MVRQIIYIDNVGRVDRGFYYDDLTYLLKETKKDLTDIRERLDRMVAACQSS